MMLFGGAFVAAASWLLVDAGDARAAVVTFANASDYDNTPNTVTDPPGSVTFQTNYLQTSGSFRDVFWWSINNGNPRVGSGDYINRDKALWVKPNTVSAVPNPNSPYSALNFTGPSPSGGETYLTVYDTTAADGAATRNLFDATWGLHLEGDFLFTKHNVAGGLFSLYSEGQDALAFLLQNVEGGNPDDTRVSLAWTYGGTGIDLASVVLPKFTFVNEEWYRLSMDVDVDGDTWTVDGRVFRHTDATNPFSALGAEVTSAYVTKSGLLSDPDSSARVLTNPGEIGIMAQGRGSISLPDSVGISVVNFGFTTGSPPQINAVPVPEPASLMVWSMLAMAGAAGKRRRSTRSV